MDGVLVDTEHLWDEVREALTEEWGGRYTPGAQQAMMGMSSREWSRYLHDVVGLREPPEVINGEVVRRMMARYETELPVVPGAVEAVRRLADAALRLALASSSNRELDRRGPARTGADAALRGNGLVGGGRTWQARPGRLRRSGRAPEGRRRAVRRGRGLGKRDPGRPRRRNAGRRVPEPALPARRDVLRARRPRHLVTGRARRGCCRQLKLR